MKGFWVVELGCFGSLLCGRLTNVEVALSLPAVLEVMDKWMANLTLWAKVQHQSEENKSSFLAPITKTFFSIYVTPDLTGQPQGSGWHINRSKQCSVPKVHFEVWIH